MSSLQEVCLSTGVSLGIQLPKIAVVRSTICINLYPEHTYRWVGRVPASQASSRVLSEESFCLVGRALSLAGCSVLSPSLLTTAVIDDRLDIVKSWYFRTNSFIFPIRKLSYCISLSLLDILSIRLKYGYGFLAARFSPDCSPLVITILLMEAHTGLW